MSKAPRSPLRMVRVHVLLPEDLLRRVDDKVEEIRSKGEPASRSSVVRSALRKYLGLGGESGD